ncbi:MAG: cell filamentation protein Fic [Nitrospinae bacterium RIFCSPLOWO2_12_39_16]|nr:MAG: cell filamentation protein Fic [Nitrospinae bacterium RIFCSPLOWO2_12_39_16]
MKTLLFFESGAQSVPQITAWHLADLGEYLGKQKLYERQAPQKLKALKEHAIIESVVSSNRIEGVNVAPARVKEVVFGRAHLRDRDEEEVRGYRKALELLHTKSNALAVSENTIRALHRLARGGIGDAGGYKSRDSEIIERYPNGRERIRFKTVPARETPRYMKMLIKAWQNCIKERWTHPLLALGAFNLDFLCVHPFRDGNGRVSRFLMLLQCYHLGYEVGRYISLERIIEENKQRYYETLEQSSKGWHDGKHDPWPYLNFVLSILKTAYKEFEERAGATVSPRGSKTEMVHHAIYAIDREFTVADIEKKCPAVSRDMIRTVLKSMQKAGKVECIGRGPGALWRKKDNTSKRG